MPRKCTICAHPKREEIDQLIVEGVPYRAIACRYGVGREAVRRHALHHLPRTHTKLQRRCGRTISSPGRGSTKRARLNSSKKRRRKMTTARRYEGLGKRDRAWSSSPGCAGSWSRD